MKQQTHFFLLMFPLLIFTQNVVNAQCISGDCLDGTGIFLYPSGAKYVGQFNNGEIDGIGTCYFSDGSKYQGEWKQRFPEGRGTKTFTDGKTWTGQWLKGQPIDEDGNIVQALFSDEKIEDGTEIQTGCIEGDCQNGHGTFAYADGSKYEGTFNKEKPNGKGAFSYANGETFIGHFKNGYKHGNGIYYHENKKQTVGEWDEGEFSGKNQNPQAKIGCISGDCKEGEGVYVFKDSAAKYSGAFKNNKPHGKGFIEYVNGEKYKGLWRNGSFDGNGTLFLMDGTEVAGIWDAGTYMGKMETGQEAKNETFEKFMPSKKEVSISDLVAFREATEMKVWAVIIGIASYDHMPTLRYTDDDAYRMFAHLKSPEGGALPDDQMRILIDEDATKEKIMGTMREVFGQAGANDLVLLYFSGHGLKGSFLPIDFDGFNNKIDHEEISEILENSDAKYKLCIADACHSGSLLAMKSGNVTNVLANYYKTLANAKGGTALIMSSKSNETSLESSGLRQGVFSHFLIRGLKGEADTDTNKVVSVQELYNFIEENVKSYTGNRQSPLIQGDYDGSMTVSVIR